MSGLIALAGALFQDLDLGAAFGGFPFEFLGIETEDGRRIHHEYLPGQDRTAFQDLGQYDGEMTITGMLVGDGVAFQAQGMRSMAWSKGPKLLDVPFLVDVMQVVLVRPLKIVMKTDRMRVADITFTVKRFVPPAVSVPDTLQSILDAIGAVRAAVRGMLNFVLAPLAIALATISFVRGFINGAIGIFDSLTAAAGDARVPAAAVVPVAALGTATALPIDTNYGGAVTDLLAAPSAAIVGTSIPEVPAAVAPGGSTDTGASPVDGRITAALLLNVAARLAPVDVTVVGAPVAVGAVALVLADAVNAASDIVFDSQQEALAWEARVCAGIEAAAAKAAIAAQANATLFGPVWRALIALETAFRADMTVTIGRLPRVVTFTPPGKAPVWILAHYLSGDRPDLMLGTYLDIVLRNGILSPGAGAAGPLEVLR